MNPASCKTKNRGKRSVPESTEEEFRQFSRCCDAILRANTMDPGIIAIDSLNLISQYPIFYDRYVNLYRNPINPLAWVFRYGGNLLRRFGELGLSLVFGKASSKRTPQQDSIPNVLIISHLLKGDELHRKDDFYFGNLHTALSEEGFNAEIHLIDHRKMWVWVKNAWQDRGKECGKPCIPKLLGFGQELKILLHALKCSFKLVANSLAYNRNGLHRRAVLSAAAEVLSYGTIHALRLFTYVSSYCSSTPGLKAVFVTWEGHSWERLVFRAAKGSSEDILCVGYQHSVILKYSHALLRSLGPQYDPNLVMVSGTVPGQIFRAATDFCKMPVVVFGSNKSRVSSAASGPKLGTFRKCLVLPQGEMAECIQMAEFLRDAAAAIPSVLFELRLHPIVDLEMVIRECPFLKQLPPNIKISSGVSLEDDLSLSTWALYRGSATSLQAVLSGVRPIYFNAPGSMNIDSLFGLDVWKRTASTVSDLEEIIESHCSSNEDELIESWRAANDYCSGYFTCPDSSSIVSHLKKSGKQISSEVG